MRKSTRIVKRLFALFLVVLMSIENFGAVVSDNDGSAFITKAEFDSLKNNFQSQIDQYNTSIDSKIDGAIASYLAGVRVAATSQWVSPYKVKDFIFWGDEFVTCIPKITSTYFTLLENSSNNLTVSGPWNGSITLHTEQDATDQTGYIVGTSDGIGMMNQVLPCVMLITIFLHPTCSVAFGTRYRGKLNHSQSNLLHNMLI